MTKDKLLEELERLKNKANEYSNNTSINTGYETAILDAIDLVKEITLPYAINMVLSDENIKKMANEYTGGEEDYKAFILACNVIAEKMKSLKLYYWKRNYHEGASFALAESLEEAKILIVEKFKSNYLEDYKRYYWVKNFIANGRRNEEEFFTEETSGAYTLLKEELEKEPQIFDATSKQGFYIWASL